MKGCQARMSGTAQAIVQAYGQASEMLLGLPALQHLITGLINEQALLHCKGDAIGRQQQTDFMMLDSPGHDVALVKKASPVLLHYQVCT